MSEKTEFKDLHFPEAPKILVEPPGPRSKEVIERGLKVDTSSRTYSKSFPIVFEEGKGATLRDVDGNLYIDFSSGISVLNVGHCNPVVVKAVQRQVEKLAHVLDIASLPRIELLELLSKIAPCDLKGRCRSILTFPAGAETVETAVQIAKYNTKRIGIIAFEGGYHGQTTGTLPLSPAACRARWSYATYHPPHLPAVYYVPYGYCYRCPFGLEYPNCDMRCLQYVKHCIEYPGSGYSDVAAVLVEPIQGEGGFVTPPDGWLSELRKICDETNVLLIVDEIQCGLGRTGKMFCCEHDNVTPDIMCLAKSLGGGIPSAAVVFKEELDTLPKKTGTFRGNVVAAAASVATINFILEKKLSERAEKLGRYLKKRLEDFAEESKVVGEVRGKGLMVGVEVVKDKGTKEPFKELVDVVQRKCLQRGLIVWRGGVYDNVFRILPPLTITERLLDKGIAIFLDTFMHACMHA